MLKSQKGTCYCIEVGMGYYLDNLKPNRHKETVKTEVYQENSETSLAFLSSNKIILSENAFKIWNENSVKHVCIPWGVISWGVDGL